MARHRRRQGFDPADPAQELHQARRLLQLVAILAGLLTGIWLKRSGL